MALDSCYISEEQALQGCPDKSSHQGHELILVSKLNMVAINELLCMKNAGAQIAMDFRKNEGLTPFAIEKIKILGSFSSYQLNSTANSAHLALFLR